MSIGNFDCLTAFERTNTLAVHPICHPLSCALCAHFSPA
jgi:hypothetical protein